MQPADHFFERFREKIEEEITLLQEKILVGTGIKSWDAYRYWAGRLEGLHVALEVARMLLAPMLSEDEQKEVEIEQGRERKPAGARIPSRRYPAP